MTLNIDEIELINDDIVLAKRVVTTHLKETVFPLAWTVRLAFKCLQQMETIKELEKKISGRPTSFKMLDTCNECKYIEYESFLEERTCILHCFEMTAQEETACKCDDFVHRNSK